MGGWGGRENRQPNLDEDGDDQQHHRRRQGCQNHQAHRGHQAPPFRLLGLDESWVWGRGPANLPPKPPPRTKRAGVVVASGEYPFEPPSSPTPTMATTSSSTLHPVVTRIQQTDRRELAVDQRTRPPPFLTGIVVSARQQTGVQHCD